MILSGESLQCKTCSQAPPEQHTLASQTFLDPHLCFFFGPSICLLLKRLLQSGHPQFYLGPSQCRQCPDTQPLPIWNHTCLEILLWWLHNACNFQVGNWCRCYSPTSRICRLTFLPCIFLHTRPKILCYQWVHLPARPRDNLHLVWSTLQIDQTSAGSSSCPQSDNQDLTQVQAYLWSWTGPKVHNDDVCKGIGENCCAPCAFCHKRGVCSPLGRQDWHRVESIARKCTAWVKTIN